MNITPLFPDKPSVPPPPSNHPVLDLISEAAALTLRIRQRGRSNRVAVSGMVASLLETIQSHRAATVPELARAGSTSRQNIQVQVNRLLKLGCVLIKTNPAHRKSSLVSLTPKGKQMLENYHGEQEKHYATLAGDVSLEEVRAALGVLRRLRANVSPQKRARKKRKLPRPPFRLA